MTSSEKSAPSRPDDERRRELAKGDLLDARYRIEGTLGAGGIGAVYRAVQLPLERPVAIKVLHDDYLSFDELRQRFEREARALSRLTHPHVVSISDYGIDGDRPFLVMELLEGRTLEDVVRVGPMDPARALDLARQILEGLAFAHDKGIAHRDLKPANVFLVRMSDGTEHIKLLDFGLARIVEGETEDDDVSLTKRGVVFGTPAYMSPEQAAGTPADVRSDVYSAGILIFELLAGRRPFVGDTRAELLRSHLADPMPRLASVRPRLRASEDLIELLDVSTAKEPGDRYTDAGDMLAAFDDIEGERAWLVGAHEVSVATTQMSIKPPPPPMTPTKIRLGMFAGALMAIAAVGLAFSWEPVPDPTLAPPGPITAPSPSVEPNEDQAPVARDPWSEPPPEPLRPFLEMVQSGHVFETRREIRGLYALAQAMPDDPRPLLLLGHLFVARAWYSDAISRYERAIALDPTVRGDPWMLDALVMLATRDSVGERAAAMIEQVYGPEALSAVQAGVVQHQGAAMAQLRLVRLRERLQAMEP